MLQVIKAAPVVSTLYVHRPLLNKAEVIEWAKSQGFITTLDDLHVTIAFSREAVDWDAIPPDRNGLVVPASEQRDLKVFGEANDAIVLRFKSEALSKRWQEFKDAGASWDWPDYQPHITITFKGEDVDVDEIVPFFGELRFGPEVYGEIKDDWKDNATEKEFDEGKHPRDDHGRWTDSGGSGDGESDEGGGGSAGGDFKSSSAAYSRQTQSPHVGISSDFDIRPGRPMPTQTGIVTVNLGSYKETNFTDVTTHINPSTSVIKGMIKDDGDVRVLQDRAGNLVVFEGGILHDDMMLALDSVETMWASDIWSIGDGGKIKSEYHTEKQAKEWVERGQSNNKTAESASVGFVSPNVRTDLSFEGAVTQLTSDQQVSLMNVSAEIDRGLGLRAKEANIIGAWADGAENSIMMTAGADWDHALVSTVMKGHIADQKSVLVFQQQRGGKAVLASFRADGKLEEIHKALLDDGLAFHTLVPDADGGGATVYVADLDGSLKDAVKKGAERYDSRVTIQFGKAQFVGDTEEFVGAQAGQGSEREQRDRARSVYERVIRESKVEGSAAVWAGVRDRGSAATQEVGTPRKIYVRSSLLEIHRLLSEIESDSDIDVIPYDGEHIPGTELICAREWGTIREWDEGKHPRDERGRWTEGGGSSADELNEDRGPIDVKEAVREIIEKVPGSEQKIKEAKELLAREVPTDAPVEKGGFKNADGSWTAGRKALHDKIIANLMSPAAIAAARPAPGQQPVIHFLGGRGGSGKSWFTRERGQIDIKKAMLLNNDEVKKELPEYKGYNVANLHEESSAIGDRMEQVARENRLNIVLDGTMRTPANLQRRVDEYRRLGYRIMGHYMYTSPTKAAQRALERFVRGGETGRFVPLEYSVGSVTNEKSFDSARDKMDFWEVYDNNTDNAEPRLHALGGTREPVPNYNPGPRTPAGGDLQTTKAVKAYWASPEKTTVKTMADAKRLALEGQKVLNRSAERIEGALSGVRVTYGEDKFTTGLKGRGGGEDRVWQKARDRGGNIAAVADLARVTFVADTPEKADQIFDELGKEFELVSEPWRITDQNYGDRAANIRLPNGIIAEVQVMDKAMNDAKKLMHPYYKITRADNVDKDSQRYKDALAIQQKTYGEVLANHPPAWRKVFDSAIRLKAWLGKRWTEAVEGLGIALRKPLLSARGR